jgi:hypothetical protein
VPRIDGSTEALFSMDVPVSILYRGQEFRLKVSVQRRRKSGGQLSGEPGSYGRLPGGGDCNAAANFGILLDEPGVAGVIQANPRIFDPGRW